MDNKQFSINDKNIRRLRGISLFENLPKNRSCDDAIIPDEYCSCSESSTMTKNDFEKETNIKAEVATKFILDHVNNITQQLRDKCVPFKFDRLHYMNKIDFKNNNKFQFIVNFQPGDAWFDTLLKIENNSLTILEQIIRASPYGTQSFCMNDSFLKSYCFCKK